MLISVEKRFVFIANTKTASTSIEQTLMDHAEIVRTGSPMRKHIALHRALEVYDFLFSQPEYTPDSFLKFGVMRDPIDWISSWFRYRKGNHVQSPLPADMTFSDFWANKDWNLIRPDGGKFLQRHMFCNPQGHLITDLVIPYQHLARDFQTLCESLGIQAPLERKNVSKITQDQVIPDDLLEEVQTFYERDYALFDQLHHINQPGWARLGHSI